MRSGLIAQRGRRMERGENCGFVVGEATFGRVGEGEIEQWATAAAIFGESEGEAIFGEIPIGARREHGGVIVQEKRQELETASQVVIWNEVWWARVLLCDRVQVCILRGLLCAEVL